MYSAKRIVLVFCVMAIPLGILWLSLDDQSSGNATGPLPTPTEHWQDDDAEQRNKHARHEWVEQMHRAAPGVDWRAIEQANGKARQELRAEALTNGNRDQTEYWTETGSRNLAGRMHAVALSAAGDSLYGGSSLGGVWKGSLDGEGWRPLSDNLYGGSHGLAVAGGTGGDPEVITSITDNGLVNYSDDAGATWRFPIGLPNNINQAKRVAHDPADPDRVYLMLRINTGMVLYLSNDAGRTYSTILALNSSVGDFWIDRVDGGAVYVLKLDTLQVSHNQGIDWTVIGSIGLGSITNVVLTASEDGAPSFYAALRNSSGWRLYASFNGGVDWEYKYDIHDFWSTLCASITNDRLVLFGGVELWRSTDGGSNFSLVNGWAEYYGDPLHKLHADLPGLDCVWTGASEIFYIATDGGLYRSDDGIASVTNISMAGLGVSQYYDTHTSINDPDIIIAGAQDQGYQRSDTANGDLPRDFTQLISGDYGHITSSDGTHGIVFSVYPGFVLVQMGENNPSLPAWLDFPSGESHSWMPFIFANPENNRGYYFCATHLYHGIWTGGSSAIYTQFAQDFTVTGSAFLTGISISPVDHDRWLAVTDIGRFWFSSDSGANWSDSGFSGPDAHYFYGTAIIHSFNDPLTAWVAGAGYSGPAVYTTSNGGFSWERMGAGLPSTLVYDLALESPDNEVLYAATEAGPFRYDETLAEWEYIGGTSAPLTTYWSVEGVPAAQLVRFGTYGRGIWDYHVATSTAVADQTTPTRSSFALANHPNPFNPRTTVHFRLDRSGPVQVEIFDLAGRRVRSLQSGHLDAGEHELVWNGRSDDGTTCPSAVYLATVIAQGRTESLRMTLAK